MKGPPAIWRLPAVKLRERRTPEGRARVPEPMVMEEETAVAAFEEITVTVSGLVTTYHVTARSISGWLGEGGHVVDLGCGSGEFLRYFAERRPDCHVLGLDLSEPMLTRARARIERAGLGSHVSVARADITDLPEAVLPERIDVVTCLNTLHQFPDVATLDRCLTQMAWLRERFGCGLWIIDLVRQRSPETMKGILKIFEPDMDDAMRRNALESEAAAFRIPELRERLEAQGLGDLRVGVGRLGTNQVHWAAPVSEPTGVSGRWVDIPPPLLARIAAKRYRGLPQRL
jgi:tRNA (cmo5U34)-methyltransferase